MVEIEINGFDESGNIGQNLIFVRACTKYENLIRPYIHNLLHFNTLTLTKSWLNGQSTRLQKEYLRMILDDITIDTNFYRFKIEDQLFAMRRFIAIEFEKLFSLRSNLINILQNNNITKNKKSNENLLLNNISPISGHLVRYMKPDKYIEQFLKSYGHKLVIKDLENCSKLLSCKDSKNSKVISLVDGGYPLVSWAYQFLRQSTLDDASFSPKNTPIFGISKGDEYFPIIQIAGNIAFIANRLGIYPQNVDVLKLEKGKELYEFIKNYQKSYGIKRSFRKIFFMGYIPMELQYTLPFILHKNSSTHEYFEAFRVKHSFKGFRKEFGVQKEEDFVIKGKIPRNSGYKSMLTEAKEMGLEIKDGNEYFEVFKDFLNDISEEARLSSLNTGQYQKIDKRLGTIKSTVKKQI